MRGDFAIQTTCRRRAKGRTSDASLSRLLLLMVVLCCVSGESLGAQGFGKFDKSKLTLHRKLPPFVHFTGSTFNIKATARETKNADASGSLKDLLETELLKDNSRLRVDANSPELAVTCNVISFDVPAPQPFTRNEVVLQKGKQIEQPVKYNKITATLEIAYQVRDTHAGRVLDADNVSEKYSEDFEQGTNQEAGKSLSSKAIDPFKRLAGKGGDDDSSGPPSTAELRSKLIHDAVHEIAARITVTNEPVKVFLAGGKLEKTNKLAESGLWTRYLEELEQMTPFPDEKDDAYRLYDIGVAYEALAYQSEDRQVASKMLQEAAINYGKAVDAKPDEKYFLEPQTRIETAMAYYRKIDGQSVEAANAASASADSGGGPSNKSGASLSAGSVSKTPAHSSSLRASSTSTPASASKPSSSGASKPASPPGPALTNDQIIKMAKAGVDDDSIQATIHDAPVVNFDLSPDGQIQLVNGGVKPKILAAMRQRAKLPNRHPNA
jgi:hypothetical protein